MPDLPAPETISLPDGTPITIRPIRPEDAPGLVAAFARLSPETVYLRFLSARSSLSLAEAQALANVDYETRMAFVAAREEDGQEVLTGVARYGVISPDRPDEAEAAIVVEDSFQGRGVGSALMVRLLDYARAHGIRAFVAAINVGNERMLGFIGRSGLPTEKRLEGGLWEIRVKIQ